MDETAKLLKEMRAAFYTCSDELKENIQLEINKLENLKAEQELLELDFVYQVN